MGRLRAERVLFFALVAFLVIVSGAYAHDMYLSLAQKFLNSGSQTRQDDFDDGYIERENVDIRPYSWLHWGFPSWIEMLIGGSVILPFSFLRFFFP